MGMEIPPMVSCAIPRVRYFRETSDRVSPFERQVNESIERRWPQWEDYLRMRG
jgi:hypothetical protein